MAAPDRFSGLASKFSLEHFGKLTGMLVNPLGGVIAAVATQVLANNPERIAWTIQNRSAAPMGLGFSGAVDLVNFFQVDANGGVFSMQLDEDGEAVTYPVWLIANAAGQIVYVLEETDR